MKVKLYGLSSLTENQVKIQSEKINFDGLLATFEANLDKQPEKDWMVLHEEITALYHILFSEGNLPQEVLDSTKYEILQYAYENMEDDLHEIMKEASASSGTNYFYEFGRSLGVEVQASRLKEYIDEEHDFI